MNFPNLNPPRSPQYKGSTTKSYYVSMRDGVRLAIDVILPRNMTREEKIPALFALTRYWRAQEVRKPFAWFISLPDSARDFFTAFGYAVIRVDVRGTGASFGVQKHPWPKSDLNDLYDLVEWVVQQPWCNGKVGGFGNSYVATMAEMLGSCGHPAVSSSFVRFNEYDVYSDIGFPGGMPNQFILKQWAAYTRLLDANQLSDKMSFIEKVLIKGVKPVISKELPAAISEHRANKHIDSALEHITFRDDCDPEMGVGMDDISTFTRPKPSMPLDHWGSWFDAATADAVIRRFVNNPNPQRAVIGAWNHGAGQHVNLETNPFPRQAQMFEALRFFDSAFGQGYSERVLYYYTTGEEKWKITSEWPPEGSSTIRMYLDEQKKLSLNPPAKQSSDQYTIDFEASTGLNNRWQTELDQRPVNYGDRGPADEKLLCYTSDPLDSDLEITGYPVVTLYSSSNQEDGAFFVYLEEIDPTGSIRYLSEGVLRAIHRKISPDAAPYKQFIPYHSYKRQDAMPLVPGEVAELIFGLQPLSAQVRQGNRIRVAVSGADKNTFMRIPAHENPVIKLDLGGEKASFIDLPIIKIS